MSVKKLIVVPVSKKSQLERLHGIVGKAFFSYTPLIDLWHSEVGTKDNKRKRGTRSGYVAVIPWSFKEYAAKYGIVGKVKPEV